MRIRKRIDLDPIRLLMHAMFHTSQANFARVTHMRLVVAFSFRVRDNVYLFQNNKTWRYSKKSITASSVFSKETFSRFTYKRFILKTTISIPLWTIVRAVFDGNFWFHIYSPTSDHKYKETEKDAGQSARNCEGELCSQGSNKYELGDLNDSKEIWPAVCFIFVQYEMRPQEVPQWRVIVVRQGIGGIYEKKRVKWIKIRQKRD